jgi:hypothetical protein
MHKFTGVTREFRRIESTRLMIAHLIATLMVLTWPVQHPAWAQRGPEFRLYDWGWGNPLHEIAIVNPVGVVTGSRLEERLVNVAGRPQPTKAFVFELSCGIVSGAIECGNFKSPKAHLAVFILVGNHQVRPLGLHLQFDRNLRHKFLSDVLAAELSYDGRYRVLNSQRLGWLPIDNAQDGLLLPDALVLCVAGAAEAFCNNPNAVPTNLADVVDQYPQQPGAEKPARNATSVPPPGIFAQAPPATSGEKLEPQTLPRQRQPLLPGRGVPPAPIPQAEQSQTTSPGPPAALPSPPHPVGDLRGPSTQPVTGAPAPPAPQRAGNERANPGMAAVPPESDIPIALTIRGAPNEYGGRQVARLVISALAGRGRSSDIVSVRVNDSGEPRIGELNVKGSLLAGLTIAGKVPECMAQLTCRADLELREWIIHLGALPEQEVPHVRLLPWYRLSDTGRLETFLKGWAA